MKKLDKLAYPVLDIPTFQHVKMFRAVETILKTDPIFPGACNLFLSYNGSADDMKEPVHAYCPYCRITPAAASSAMATERQHAAPLAVLIDVAIRGTNFDQLGNFWGVIWSAIFSQADPVRFGVVTSTLQAAGITRPVMTMQGFFPVGDNVNNYMLIGNGTLMFNSLLPF